REDGDRADRLAHPPPPDHLPRELGQLLDVRLGARADVAEDDLLRDATAERDPDPCVDLRLEIVEPVALRRGERDAERDAARDDRDLAHGIRAGREHADDRMTALVVRGPATVGLA